MPAVGAALVAGWTALSGSAVFTFLTTNTFGRLLLSVGASALMQAVAAPKLRPGGSQIGFASTIALTGGTNPCRFPLGLTMTAGQHVCPPMTHGTVDKTPNAYMTYVVLLSNVKGCQLERVIINDDAVNLGSTLHGQYGAPVLGRYEGYAWVKYYDGSQTSADPYLLARYGSYPRRPWSAEMIGRGLCYAIVTLRQSPEKWAGGGQPRVRFVLSGIPLYDIRKDSTAGGSGAHRWSNRATWEPSDNPFVQIYNIKRGITLADGDVWGGGMAASALDTSTYAAAMNECNRLVNKSGGGTERQFRSGIEVTVDRQPSEYIAEILKGASGQVVDMGGLWKGRAGGAGVPVFYFTDDDIVVTRPQDFKPFPGLEASFNGITASYPEPDQFYTPKDAPARYNAAWETEDRGRRRVAHLQLPGVPYASQVQRLMKAYIAEERRFRRHAITLPPRAAILEPLDEVSWSSVHNGYIDKAFEIAEIADDLVTCLQRLALRERDPTDYDYPSDLFLPTEFAVPGDDPPPAQAVAAFTVSGVSIPDEFGTARRPALLLAWNGEEQDDVTGIQWEVRVQTTATLVNRGTTQNVAAGQMIIQSGILGGTVYEVRVRLIAPRDTTWSIWISVTAPNVGIKSVDFQGSIQEVFRNANLAAVEIVSALPTTGNFAGRTVFLTTDFKLYRHAGTPGGSAGFTAAVPAVDVTGQLTDAQIAAIAAAKVTGQITGTQITDGSISTPKLQAGAVTTAALAAGSVTADDLATWAVTAGKIAAGAVTAGTLAAGAVTAGTIAANAITAGLISAGAINTTELIVDGAVSRRVYKQAQTVIGFPVIALNNSYQVIAEKTFPAGTFADWVGPTGDRRNPILVNIDLGCDIGFGETGWRNVTWQLEFLLSGAWEGWTNRTFKVPLDIGPGDFQYSKSLFIDSGSWSLVQGARLRMLKTGGLPVIKVDGSYMMTQISV